MSYITNYSICYRLQYTSQVIVYVSNVTGYSIRHRLQLTSQVTAYVTSYVISIYVKFAF